MRKSYANRVKDTVPICTGFSEAREIRPDQLEIERLHRLVAKLKAGRDTQKRPQFVKDAIRRSLSSLFDLSGGMDLRSAGTSRPGMPRSIARQASAQIQRPQLWCLTCREGFSCGLHRVERLNALLYHFD